MDILIIEDEVKTARALGKLIKDIRPEATILGPLQTVRHAVEFLQANAPPALIFMDIQLADGSSFEIFPLVRVSSPIIFCTAFDKYALEAFRENGIDYILKPFTIETLRRAFLKLDSLKSALAGESSLPFDLSKLFSLAKKEDYKHSFMVFGQNKYQTISVKDIVLFALRNESTYILASDGGEYPLQMSLDEIVRSVSPDDFFRINRQSVINFHFIKEVEHYFARKLLIRLKVSIAEKLFVGREKSTTFLSWLEQR
ncbi:DNA-binding LytR/AlgR family response regulator [Pedobacter sp. AK017]|uniref:LytR/AlgR family response regulator transcription factor n=1 Tax=Pedobacter sp. AK017 TaxID=2723073 RepID=UPI0016203FA0|nr:LytTR family DNA-binding domain-containing protein [Pedobacter sp. AK017]MBB5440463.1 DNA-binding LytR/AlgR family response regulator [Pedobacter sp. AK017]